MATLKSLVDETSNIKNELIECHVNLKNNLVEKGIECNEDDKISNLIDKVGNIALGKKWGSGNTSDISGYETKTVTVATNLSFTPSLIFLYLGKGYGINSTTAGSASGICVTNLKRVTFVSGYNCSVSINNITSSSFNVTISPSQQKNFVMGGLVWYAFE